MWATDAIIRAVAPWAPRLAACVVVGAASVLAALPAAGQPAAARSPASAPNLDALPRPLANPSIDLEALSRGYTRQLDGQAGAEALQRGPALIVFISLAMPRPSLNRLLDQAARAGATLLLRGFSEGSLRHTVSQLQPLIGQRQVAVQIDPTAFDRYGIARVPSFVLLRDGARAQPCAAGQCPPPGEHLAVAGDVSIDYALAHMQRAAPAFRADAALFLSRLQP